MKIYTKTGDCGETGVLGGPRLSKDHLRIEAYGTVDELNAILGMARAVKVSPRIDSLLLTVQNELFAVGAQLASIDPAAVGTDWIGQESIASLEQEIDLLEEGLEPLRQFILPGGTLGAAILHQARAVCRRAERRLITLTNQPEENISTLLIVYLNRLGDFLFVLARAANAEAGVSEHPWEKPKKKKK